ncbi:MAG: hypothetical protein A3I66_11695 [Burkholderiales bacterium RIFCSPLOWO2_02_FULL_57_36]|nr:MAG: hypothetical protein A3I66_11695 [Burkholderiales bacterium RIFCSPLOWO2_02_FULL_57_36]
MTASWFITNIISALLLPPLVFILPSLAGFMLYKRRPRFGAALCVVPLIALVVFSTGIGAKWLAASIEDFAAPLTSAQASGAQAIVVLGGGRSRNAVEYGGRDTVSSPALVRLRYAAKLHRETGLPILVTGGTPDGSSESEAALMARALHDDFAIAAKWQEHASENTAQNAQFSAQQLKAAGIQRVLLVTDAMHMARSRSIFIHSGLQIVSAPTGFYSRAPVSPIDFVPNGHALYVSSYAMHEWIGIAWYSLRHGSAIRLMRDTTGPGVNVKHPAS